MKRSCAVLLTVLMLGCFVPVSLAQVEIDVYIAQSAMSDEMAAQVMQLLERALPEASFLKTQNDRTLAELVMADEAPQIAICAAEEAAIWAQEGLLADLTGCMKDAERMPDTVKAACMREDKAYMIPLRASHHLVAVNRRGLETLKLEHLLNFRAYPVWLPIQLHQVLEEKNLDGGMAMEIWPAVPGETSAVFALIQALHNGVFLEDGEYKVDSDAAIAGMQWVEEMVNCGMIGMAEDRQTALERFFKGETLIFIDWTEDEAQAYASLESKPEVFTMAYPSSSGIPVHAFEVTGAAVFESGDTHRDAMAQAAAAFLMGDAQAQQVLGRQTIEDDGAIWLPCLGTSDEGMALRGALCEAIEAVFDGSISARAAMEAANAAIKGR